MQRHNHVSILEPINAGVRSISNPEPCISYARYYRSIRALRQLFDQHHQNLLPNIIGARSIEIIRQKIESEILLMPSITLTRIENMLQKDAIAALKSILKIKSIKK